MKAIKCICAVAAVAGVAVAGQVRVPAAAAAGCPPLSPVNPFAPWGDRQPYMPTTGGSFEPGQPAWSLSGGAAVVSGNEPFHVNRASDRRALFLPAGSSATSACVTAPGIVGIVRFFARSSGVATGQLKVEVLVKGGVYQAETITAGSAWAPSPMLASDAPAYKGR